MQQRVPLLLLLCVITISSSSGIGSPQTVPDAAFPLLTPFTLPFCLLQDNFEATKDNGAFEAQYRRLLDEIQTIYESAKEFHGKVWGGALGVGVSSVACRPRPAHRSTIKLHARLPPAVCASTSLLPPPCNHGMPPGSGHAHQGVWLPHSVQTLERHVQRNALQAQMNVGLQEALWCWRNSTSVLPVAPHAHLCCLLHPAGIGIDVHVCRPTCYRALVAFAA